MHKRSYCPFLMSSILIIIGLITRVQSLASNGGVVSLGTLTVAPIALGSLNLSVDKADQEQTAHLLDSLPPATLIDTAEIYGKGKAERAIASAVKKKASHNLFFATKFAPQLLRTSAESIVKACKESASRLGVDCIDLYQVHYSDSLLPLVSLGVCQPKDEVYWDGLAECYHQGLAANVGVCNYGPTMIRRAHEALSKRGVPLVSNQIGFSLMRCGITSETKDVCDELGIKVLAYSPLGKGVISGKYDIEDRSKMPVEIGKYYRFKRCLKETVELRNVLEKTATARQKTWPQVVYNWAICKGTIPIAGARDARQAADIVGAMGWSLTDAEVAELDAVAGDNITPTREFVLV